MPSLPSKKAGRPLRGLQKRVRTSFTLEPQGLRWLENQARIKKVSKSTLFDQLIEKARSQEVSSPDQILLPQIPIPRHRIAAFCKKYNIIKMALFGSVLTENFSDESDIDILVEFKAGSTPGLFEVIKIQKELSRLFNDREIDLKTPRELSRYFREDVLSNSQVIYAQ